MTRIFGHYVVPEMVVLWLVETLICVALMQSLLGGGLDDPMTAVGPATVVTLTGGVIAVSIGLYRQDVCLRLRRMVLNTAIAGVLAFPAALITCRAFGIDVHALAGRHDWLWPIQLLLAWVLLLIVTRLLLALAMRHDLLTRRVLLVGAWTESVLDAGRPGFIRVVGQVRMPPDGALDAREAELDPRALRARRIWGLVTEGPATRALPAEVLAGCQTSGIRVFGDADFLEQHVGRLDVEQLQPDWLANAPGVPGSRAAAIVRRAGDLVIASLFVVFGMPVMLLAALVIRLDSPGPVFYRQVRVGLHGKPFTLVKFRSMRIDAEARGPAWASQRDPRVTRVGGFLRRTRIDELPQLINVLRGEMGFIGPRPERPHFVETLAEAIPFYRDRASVKPGLTGWAQVNFPYGASIEDARMKLSYDLYYVKHRSLFLDLLILISTVRVILFQEGAR